MKPKVLFAVAVPVLLVIGGFVASRYVNQCGGIASCIWSAINPLEARPRGAGVPLGCPLDRELSGALCYERCPEGYTGVAFVCWQNCPEGFRDDGAYCNKVDDYFRGPGYAIWDEQKCKDDNGEGNCELTNSIWYPKSAAGYHVSSQATCRRDTSAKCPPGMTDSGISCQKQTKVRDAGNPVTTCPLGTVQDGLLCYPPCPKGFDGAGPVCWEHIGPP